MNLNVIPPHALVLFAVVAIQLGAALSIKLFPALGTEGTVAVRIIFSAVLLGLAARGRALTFGQTFRANWALLLGFGLSITVMYFCFYQAIARIPLGAAVAFEFIGPLGVAAFTSRRLGHFAWIALAALGIFLLSPFSGAELDQTGILFALLAGAGWALFVVFSVQVGQKVPGNDGLAIGMVIAALTMIPFIAPVTNVLATDRWVLLLSIVVALLSTTVPFTLEFQALKRLPARTYGILVAVEPAVAAGLGALLLGDHIGIQGMIAVACVVTAAIGITISDGRNQQPINPV